MFTFIIYYHIRRISQYPVEINLAKQCFLWIGVHYVLIHLRFQINLSQNATDLFKSKTRHARFCYRQSKLQSNFVRLLCTHFPILCKKNHAKQNTLARLKLPPAEIAEHFPCIQEIGVEKKSKISYVSADEVPQS